MFHLNEARPLIPMYMHLLLSALFPIYTGAHASLSRPSSAAPPDKASNKKSKDEEDENEEEEVPQQMEGMSNTDAIVLPVTAGIVLMGLYFAIQWYGAEVINLVLGWYFAGVGVLSVAKLVNDAGVLGMGFVWPTWFANAGKLWRVREVERKVVLYGEGTDAERTSPLPGVLASIPLLNENWSWTARVALKKKYAVKAYIARIIDLRATTTSLQIFSSILALGAIVYANTVSKPWFLTNLQGFAVSYAALQLMSPTTFATGSLILMALFCYDVWAVFFTPFMVGVAKNLDQPIKLVFPRPDGGAEGGRSYSMLGLGDIVLPGIMIGLALRFDLYLFYLRKQKMKTTEEEQEEIEKTPYVSATGKWGEHFWTRSLPTSALPPQLRASFPKPYFTASIVGYVAGMLATLGVMSVFQHAQPALLYLVPGVLGSLWGTALVRGEVKEMWGFSEAVTGEQIEVEGGEEGEAKEEGPAKGVFERLWAEIWGGEATKVEAKDGEKVDVTEAAMSKQGGEDEHDGLLFAFSMQRYDPSRRSAKTTAPSESGTTTAQDTPSSSGSESSDDPVVVSTTDLAGGASSTGATQYQSRGSQRSKRMKTG